jgi:hypothetical protein
MRIPNDLFEGISDFATAVYLNIRGAVHGKVVCYYNQISDCLEVTINNRVLNCEEFHYTYPYFLKEMKNGISAYAVSSAVLSEYKTYVELYIWKEDR